MSSNFTVAVCKGNDNKKGAFQTFGSVSAGSSSPGLLCPAISCLRTSGRAVRWELSSPGNRADGHTVQPGFPVQHRTVCWCASGNSWGRWINPLDDLKGEELAKYPDK